MENLNLNPKLKSHFLNLYALALSDNVFDTTEMELLYKIGKERSIDINAIEELIMSHDKVEVSNPETLDEKIEFLFDYARIIWADGKVNENEIKTLENFCIQFGFLEENAALMAQFFIDQVKLGSTLSDVLSMVQKTM